MFAIINIMNLNISSEDNKLMLLQYLYFMYQRWLWQPETGQANCSSQSIPKKEMHKNIRINCIISN